MRRVRAFSISVAGVVAVAVGGCGSGDPPETPAACLVPAAAYLTALESAPGAVTLSGGTPISECIAPEQEPGALAQVGRSVVGAATRLNAAARRQPRGDATVELGYLVGAVQEGAASTGGVHEDLKLRLDSAARFRPDGGTFPLSFERAFGTGYAAGRSTG